MARGIVAVMLSDPWGWLVGVVFLGGLTVLIATTVGIVWNLARPTGGSVALCTVVAVVCALSGVSHAGRWLGPEIQIALFAMSAANAGAAILGWRMLDRTRG